MWEKLKKNGIIYIENKNKQKKLNWPKRAVVQRPKPSAPACNSRWAAVFSKKAFLFV